MLIDSKTIKTSRYTELLTNAVIKSAEIAHQQVAATSTLSRERPKKDRESYKKALLGVS